MKDIKLIALDIDGTLIDNNLEVSKNTKNIIEELKGRGIEVALVSGRAHAAAKLIMDQFDIDLPIISHNGGKVTLANGKEIKNEKFPIACVEEVLEYAREHDLDAIAYIDDLFYTTVNSRENEELVEKYGVDFKVVDSLKDSMIDEINLLLLYLNDEVTEEDVRKFESLECETTNSIPNTLEFIPEGISKAEGLKSLKNHLGIKRENILAVGNSLNDLSMLEFAGEGIAMKNSDKLLLENFHRVSEFTNNEEGVYRILKEL